MYTQTRVITNINCNKGRTTSGKNPVNSSPLQTYKEKQRKRKRFKQFFFKTLEKKALQINKNVSDTTMATEICGKEMDLSCCVSCSIV